MGFTFTWSVNPKPFTRTTLVVTLVGLNMLPIENPSYVGLSRPR